MIKPMGEPVLPIEHARQLLAKYPTFEEAIQLMRGDDEEEKSRVVEAISVVAEEKQQKDKQAVRETWHDVFWKDEEKQQKDKQAVRETWHDVFWKDEDNPFAK